jgi:nitrite reductase/ring-hydroxylating ferredoxin subunit
MTATAVGLSRDLPDGRAMRALLPGRDLVVWRSGSGRLTAWDNRCPHRGMRLSFGFVRGEVLACLYHGWQFSAEDGRCRHIPAHPDLEPPETIRARAYPVGEAGGLIWVAAEDSALDVPQTGPATRALRTIAARADAHTLGAAFKSTPFDGEPPDPVADGAITQLSVGGTLVALALQDTGAGETAAHVLVAPAAGRGELTRLSRWCESVRRAAESAAAPNGLARTARDGAVTMRKEEPA